MDSIAFRSRKVMHTFPLTSLGDLASESTPRRTRAFGEPQAALGFDPAALIGTLQNLEQLRSRVPTGELGQLAVVGPTGSLRAKVRPRGITGDRGRDIRSGGHRFEGEVTLLTPTVIVEAPSREALGAARTAGATVVGEGRAQKILLQVESIEQVSSILEALSTQDVRAVAPNFLRLRRRGAKRPAVGIPAWAHETIGVAKAWERTRGESAIKVAVLDEGVDTSHPALRNAIAAERDFVGGKGMSAMPDNDDAHGTACAGIIASQAPEAEGIAPGCQLLAARIAIGDAKGDWTVWDDFATADAVDWATDQGADVLSNSWSGGIDTDPMWMAFERALTQGRGGLGAVVCVSAGNEQEPLGFPGLIDGLIAVGASNQFDTRKTYRSDDGEFWGSNYGSNLSILAPGVAIRTTDIAGSTGYGPDDFVDDFNGTSAAAPHVAATAALMLSANPSRSQDEIRHLLQATAREIDGRRGWTAEHGFGRLDAGRAVAGA